MKNIINDASVNEWFAQQMTSLTPMKMLLALLMGFIVGLIIALVYRKAFRGVLFSPSFANTLIMLCMITTPVVMCIKSNIALSMGMVGALSIIRFRTAVKDPIDTVFMFWAVGEGIAVGTKYYDIAVIAALTIGVIMVVLTVFKGKASMPYLLILHYHEGAGQQVRQMVKQLPNARMKSKTAQRDGIELTMELRLRENETGFVEKFLRVDGVYDATLISHQGDIIS